MMAFKKVLFVCMGNSCSSPMAEAILQNLMIKTNLYWEVSSAALRTWNVGRRPNKKCMRILKEHGLRKDHYCRLLSLEDFRYYDHIIAMNLSVYKELLLWAKQVRSSKHVELNMLTWFTLNGKEAYIQDLSPLQKLRDFRTAYYQIKNCCKAFLANESLRYIQFERESTEFESSGTEDSEEYRRHNERLEEEDALSRKSSMGRKI